MNELQIRSEIVQAARRHDVPPHIALAVAWVESRFSPEAVSPAGAMGVMQLMPATAEFFGVTDPYDPRANIDAGVRLLARNFERFGRWEPALAAYNWGHTRVERRTKKQHWPRQVQGYVRRVLARAHIEQPNVHAHEPDRRGAPELDDRPIAQKKTEDSESRSSQPGFSLSFTESETVRTKADEVRRVLAMLDAALAGDSLAAFEHERALVCSLLSDGNELLDCLEDWIVSRTRTP